MLLPYTSAFFFSPKLSLYRSGQVSRIHMSMYSPTRTTNISFEVEYYFSFDVMLFVISESHISRHPLCLVLSKYLILAKDSDFFLLPFLLFEF
jgi:hypothetical protein